MDYLSFLNTTTTTGGGSSSWIMMIGYVVIIGGLFYFMAIRPQKKQQKQMSALISSLAIGDSVLTTSGFYGVVIDVMDEVIIVEFGNNKNCRIPMKKSAVVEVEKPETEESK
jgi:preprotein translocase subunit YajC